MKSINIWNAETFEKNTAGVSTGAKDHKGNTIWVKSRPIGFFGIVHRFNCAWEVFNGKADIIRFYKQ
jgi:hypothetical protein